MSSIRRRVAVLAVLLLAGAGASPWPGRPVAAAPAQAQPPADARAADTCTTGTRTADPGATGTRRAAGAARRATAGPRRPADLPRRHQLRARRRDRHRPQRQPGHRSDARPTSSWPRTASRRPSRRSAWCRSTPSAPVESQRRLTTRADEEIAAQDEDARIVVFFLDDYHVRLGNSMAARKHLAEFVPDAARPTRPGRGDVPARARSTA